LIPPICEIWRVAGTALRGECAIATDVADSSSIIIIAHFFRVVLQKPVVDDPVVEVDTAPAS
jgi:hypothetical protein